jgi:nucleoside-diphosphate-sugar epimerase
MGQAFTPSEPLAESSTNGRRTVLVTGAAGNIGSYFARSSHKRYDLRLMVHSPDKPEAKAIAKYGRVVEGNLEDLEGMTRLCRGVDTILHLAASAGPNSVWETEVLPNNIVGCYNVFAAAKAAKVRRVIFASSIHAVSGYPADVQVKASDPVNPGDLYGVSKCFGEALARYMAEQEGVSSICLRIGGFQPNEEMEGDLGIQMMDAWVSQRDLNQLIEKSIDADNIKFAIFNGLSDNRFKRLDISNARELLGYAPKDDLTEVNAEVKGLRLRERVMAHSMKDEEKSGLRETMKKLKGKGGGKRGRG